MKRLLIFSILLLAAFRPGNTAAQDADTLDVVNWNLEWFADGDTHDPARQVSKARQIMNIINADVYALCEIVNVDSLHSLVGGLNDDYGYVVSSFGSFASDPGSSGYASAQKLALVYRKSMMRQVTGRALMNSSTNAYYNFASGRFPYLVRSEVKGKDGQWRPLAFIVLHAKANSDYQSCTRRTWGANEMKDTLDVYFSSDRFLVAGDFNDDLSGSICTNSQSAYSKIVKDSVDNNSYRSVTLPLSLSGEYSIQGYSHLIDHVVASDEMYRCYVPGSAASLRTKVKTWVSNYEDDVSDHYPILSRYVMDATTIGVPSFAAAAGFRVYPNPAREQITIEGRNLLHYSISDLQGRIICEGALTGATSNISLPPTAPGIYAIRCRTKEGHVLIEKITVL